MEQTTPPQGENKNKGGWELKPEIIVGFVGVVIFILFVVFNHNPQQVAVQGASTSILPTATPIIAPTDTPVPTITPSPTPTTSIAPTQSTMQSAQPATIQEQGLSNNNYYTNSSGNEVHSPAYSNDGSVPAGATAKCADGTYSFSQHRSGTCSHHGGVAQWL